MSTWKYNLSKHSVEEQPTIEKPSWFDNVYEDVTGYKERKKEWHKHIGNLRSIPVSGTVDWKDGEVVTGKFTIEEKTLYRVPGIDMEVDRNAVVLSRAYAKPITIQEQPQLIKSCKKGEHQIVIRKDGKENFCWECKMYEKDIKNQSQEQPQKQDIEFCMNCGSIVHSSMAFCDVKCENEYRKDQSRDESQEVIEQQGKELFEWVKARIYYLESIRTTEYGSGALNAYKSVKEQIEWLKPVKIEQQDNIINDADRWISVKDKPLIHQNNLGWEVNKGVPDEFLAALRVTNKIDGKTSWWIRHCVIEDETGLCVVGDDENEPCGWQITDIEFYQPIPLPPKTLP